MPTKQKESYTMGTWESTYKWFKVAKVKDWFASAVYIHNTPEGKIVAHGYGDTPAEAVFNGRLIASAPRMAEILKLIAERFKHSDLVYRDSLSPKEDDSETLQELISTTLKSAGVE